MRDAYAPGPGDATAATRSGPDRILGENCAFALAFALILGMALVEGAHRVEAARGAAVERVVQLPPAVSAPARHRDLSAPDPGDNP